ncbi:MAG: hypothetical protein K0S53_392 [Bacteroidetes bacterium]|jgi:hypothetical protein|nr:hypothetical protein [Bacteroidota bacterium]
MENIRCINCKNYVGGLICLAFETIPEEILTGENDHEKPLPNQDNDIIYEPLDEEQPS